MSLGDTMHHRHAHGPGGRGFQQLMDLIGLQDAPPAGAGRARRGDVRTATLLLLTEQPMHGYQIIREITDRSGGVRAAKLSDLRGSGTIEADTNCAIYVESTPNEDGGEELHGADAYKDVPIRVVKNRDGATGRFSMRWQPQYHSWEPTPNPADDFREEPGGMPDLVQQQFDIQDSLDDGRYRARAGADAGTCVSPCDPLHGQGQAGQEPA